MSKYWNKFINDDWITNKITDETVRWSQKFGSHLAKKGDYALDERKIPKTDRRGNNIKRLPLSTSQLRKFFGEVKRLQVKGFSENTEVDFQLLKPKLAYAVGRAKNEDAKIHDFYYVLSDGIDKVKGEAHFKNFIKIFEAVVAYHKAAEESNLTIS